MSDCGAAIRDRQAMEQALSETRNALEHVGAVAANTPEAVVKAYKLRDLLMTQGAVLTAMVDFAETAGGSRGSSLYTDPDGDLRDGLDELFRFRTAPKDLEEKIQMVCWDGSAYRTSWRPVRPLPENADFFENVWRQYRENRNVY